MRRERSGKLEAIVQRPDRGDDISRSVQALVQIEAGDRRLLAGIADVMAEAARRSGDWLVCRPGCTQCCMGPFAITQLDALRLREGLSALAGVDPARAERVCMRAAAYVAAIAPYYPGDSATGELWDDDSFPPSMDDVYCPVLDPDTGRCDLYAARPITCRAFGPATRVDPDTLVACELCYVGATDEEMAQCAVDIDPEGLEGELLGALDATGVSGMTIVAYALTVENRAPDLEAAPSEL
jgi:Fe-S-cluster containining protein